MVECVYDFVGMEGKWNLRWTYIPVWNGKEWIPSEEYASIEKGPGWRKGGWKPLRIRMDKTNGNSLRTVENVFKSITDNITVEEIDALIPKR